jgi:hypothetical protein
VRLRAPALVAAALAVAALTLTSCRTNVGTAATVDGQRISENTLSSYVLPQGPSSDEVSAAQQQGTTIQPRPIALQFLVQEKVYEQVLKANGGIPSDGALTAVHDAAVQLLVQSQTLGAAFDRQIESQLTKLGIDAKLRPVFVRVQELEYTIIQRQHLQQQTQLAALVKKSKVGVSVSPRYGKWDTANLQINSSGAVPGYLDLTGGSGSASASASAAG